MSETNAAAFPKEMDSSGRFKRQESAFRNSVSADDSTGFKAEAGRYHLYVSYACPWASRAIAFRKLKGLEDVISMTVVDPIRDEKGWAIRDVAGCDPVDVINGFKYLSEAYLATDSSFEARVTVPVLWDKKTGVLVNNESSEIIRMLNSEFNEFAQNPELDLYPEALRSQVDQLNGSIYDKVNNGVYKSGFATSQAAYDEAVTALFAELDRLEVHLATRRYLCGDQLTEADVRLFVTLVRFDPVYVCHFKCNIKRITDYPNLWAYSRDIYQHPGISETVNFDHIKRHYFITHPQINPFRIVPLGPELDWLEPHGRG